MTFDTGKSIFATIEAIAATASKLEKDALVSAAGETSKLFKKVVEYAYDPFRNYGIRHVQAKTPGLAPGTNTLEEPFVFQVLDDLTSGKLSGNAAKEKVKALVELLDEPSSEIFRRIINKDMRAGFSDGTLNRAFKGLLKVFPYMRCSLPAKSNMSNWDWEDGIIVQEKADGMFVNVNCDATGFVWITSRAGSRFPADCMGIESDLEKVLTPNTQTHGELTVYEAGKLLSRQEGNGVMNSLLSGGTLEPHQRVVYEAWDQIPLAHVVSRGKYEVPCKTRLKNLAIQCANANRSGNSSIRLIPTIVVTSKEAALARYRELLLKGKEGVVCKHPAAIWKDGTSKDQVKLKLEAVVDLKIIKIVPGKEGGKNEGKAGSFTCESSCGGLRVDVTVKNDALRSRVDLTPGDFINKIIAVCANSILEQSDSNELCSLFLPRMVEADTRLDKSEADSLQEVRDQFDAAMEAA